MSHRLIFVIVAAVFAIAAIFLGYGMGKASKTTLVGSQFGIWIGGILSAFVGGLAKGAPVGSSAGTGLAALSHNIHADLTLRHVAIEALFLLAAPIGTGITKVDNYVEANPMPNLFTGKPSIPSTPPEPPNPQLNKKPNEVISPTVPLVLAPIVAPGPSLS